MIALGELSPIETAQAALQEKIGDFLSARARLIRLMNNPSLTVQGKARGLYAIQLQLEDQLYKEILPKVQGIKEGVWSLSDVAILGMFTSNIVRQINDTNNLGRQGGDLPVQPLFGSIGNRELMIGGMIVVLGAVALWVNKR